MKDRVRKDARRAALAPETGNSGISVGHARRVASHHAVLYIIGGPTPTQKAQRKKSLPERHRYQVEKRRKMQGIQIAAPSLATSWKNRRGSRYVAKVVIGGEKRRYVQCRFSRRFFGFFREIFFWGVARRFVDGIFSRWSYREMQPYQTRMQGILEPVIMGPPMMQSRTQNA